MYKDNSHNNIIKEIKDNTAIKLLMLICEAKYGLKAIKDNTTLKRL